MRQISKVLLITTISRIRERDRSLDQLAKLRQPVTLSFGPEGEAFQARISEHLVGTARAVAEAHMRIWQSESQFPYLVFEDDVLLRDDSRDILEEGIQQLPESWDILYLGALIHGQPARVGGKLLKISRAGHLHGYLVNQSAAPKLIDKTAKWLAKCDGWFDDLSSPLFELFHVDPIVAIQRSGHSCTDGKWIDREGQYWGVFRKHVFFAACSVSK